MRRERENKDLALYALMVTDVLEQGTELLVAGDVGAVARSFGVEAEDSTIALPGVMSRKKEVAPKLLRRSDGAARRPVSRSLTRPLSAAAAPSVARGASPHSCSSR